MTANATAVVNWVTVTPRQACAICVFCDRQSPAVQVLSDGRPDLFELAGWLESPFPSDFEHGDTSRGSIFTCPSCNQKRLNRMAAGLRPLLRPSRARRLALVARAPRQHAPLPAEPVAK